MLEIVEGSLAEIKEEMKQAKAKASEERSRLIKQYGSQNLRRKSNIPKEDLALFTTYEGILNHFKVSSCIPVRFNNMLVNYKLLMDFEKKLKGYQIEICQLTDFIIVRYWKYRSKTKFGQIQLLSLPAYCFENLKSIPTAVTKYELFTGGTLL